MGPENVGVDPRECIVNHKSSQSTDKVAKQEDSLLSPPFILLSYVSPNVCTLFFSFSFFFPIILLIIQSLFSIYFKLTSSNALTTIFIISNLDLIINIMVLMVQQRPWLKFLFSNLNFLTHNAHLSINYSNLPTSLIF